MLKEFFTWWGETLLDMAPSRLTGGGRAVPDALVVTPQGTGLDHVALSLRRGRGQRALGTFAAGGTIPVRIRAARTVLRVPAAMVLGRELVLPLAAERQVNGVLEHEIDRLTPFAAAELYWSATVLRRDRARGKLHVHLSLVPRAGLQPLLDALARSGITPTLLEAEAPEGGTVRIDLRAAPHRPLLTRHVERGLVVACAGLALAVVALPFVWQSLGAARVDSEIAALRPRVEAAEAARRRIAAAAAGVDVIAAARLRLGDTLAVLAALTDVLPDDTSLTELTLREGRLTLSGQSAAAARLIGALSTDPAIRNPDFAAPVTRVEGGRADLFSIRAEVAN